jgi:hypothetical protein
VARTSSTTVGSRPPFSESALFVIGGAGAIGLAVHMGCYVELDHARRDSTIPRRRLLPRRSAAENDEGPAQCAGPSTFVSDD